MTRILRIDASVRRTGSTTRSLTDRLIDRYAAAGATVATRDLAEGMPLIDEAWVGANFTPADERDGAQSAALALSDEIVEEVKAADLLVIGTPIYNFSVPAGLKAWIDHLARAGVTFKYSEAGPVGLLEDKKAIVVLASGGTEMDSEIDFAGRYLRHVLGFVGITDVTFVRADRLAVDAEGTLRAAEAAIAELDLVA